MMIATTTTMATTMATDVDDDEGNNASWVTITIATTAKMPAHRRQLRLRIGDDDDTASREAAAHQEAEAVRRDATRQPAGTNKEEGSRIDVFGGCVTKGGARRRHYSMQKPAGKREANGRRSASGQEAMGPQ